MSHNIFLTHDGSLNITVNRGSGRQDKYTRNFDGSYTAPAGVNDTLVKNADNPPRRVFDTFTLTLAVKQATQNFYAIGGPRAGRSGPRWTSTAIGPFFPMMAVGC